MTIQDDINRLTSKVDNGLSPFQKDIPSIVFTYLRLTLINVLKDQTDPVDWRATAAPILGSLGWPEDRVTRLLGLLDDTVFSGYFYEERLEEVVPFETPVQMSSAVAGLAEGAGKGKVRLDWLSSRKVLSSRVDRARMERLDARNRQRKEKRGLLPSSEPSEGTIATTTTSSVPQLDSKAIERAMLEDILAGGAGADEEHRRSRDIKLDDFDIAIHGKRILTNAQLTVAFGRRYGLIGRNGIGKSTLLRYLSSRQLPVPAHLSILHVEQEIAGDDTPAITSVLQADIRRELLLAEEKRLADATGPGASERLAVVHKRLHEISADLAESRAATILAGLGFPAGDQHRPTRTFSGGWRMRIALARALFCQPDILLLDEPTNMLDIPAVTWLEEYLQEWPSTLIVVSHDRFFLDAVATDILHVHHEQVDHYRGNYTQFTVTRDERIKNAQREYETQLQYRQHLQSFVDRWRCNANRASQAQSRLKILEKLPELEPVVVDPPVVFKFPPVEALSPPLITATGVSFGYNGAGILDQVDFSIGARARMAIVGPNGAGKTTLLKLLIGQLDPVSGMVSRSGRLRIAYFSQHHVDHLDLSLNSVELMARRFPGKSEEEYRRALGAFGLTGPLALQVIGTLSGGQKSRVSFACLAATNPHLLILDEPTNHLDMDSIDALIRAIQEWDGAVVAVSHDKRFVGAVCDEIWVCKERQVALYRGTIMDYCKSLLK